MGKRKKRVNPFYVLLVLAGIVFVVTACAYGVMMVQQLEPSRALALQQQTEGLIPFMARRGDQLLLIEVVVLALATFAAIGTDRFWTGDEPTQQKVGDQQVGDQKVGAGQSGNPSEPAVSAPSREQKLVSTDNEEGETA